MRLILFVPVAVYAICGSVLAQPGNSLAFNRTEIQLPDQIAGTPPNLLGYSFVAGDGRLIGRYTPERGEPFVAFRQQPDGTGFELVGEMYPFAMNHNGMAVGATSGFQYATVSLPGEQMIQVHIPGASSSALMGVSSSGMAVGAVKYDSHLSTPITWKNGIVSELGLPNGFVGAEALGVSDDGRIVVGLGVTDEMDDDGVQLRRAVWWEDGVPKDTGIEYPSVSFSRYHYHVSNDGVMLMRESISADPPSTRIFNLHTGDAMYADMFTGLFDSDSFEAAGISLDGTIAYSRALPESVSVPGDAGFIYNDQVIDFEIQHVDYIDFLHWNSAGTHLLTREVSDGVTTNVLYNLVPSPSGLGVFGAATAIMTRRRRH